MQRNSTPIAWRPRGVSDTLDASESFKGAMAALTNLIPDPTTKTLWQCRPAAIQTTAFAGFTTPGFISALKVIGNLAFGMIASGRNAGHDEPFCYNLLTNAFVVVSGITAGNTPNSPATTGAWTPPTMDVIGASLVVTHPGFNGAGNVWFGWFDITNPAAPAWHGGNLSGAVSFSVAPSMVRQFNGRAYYIHNLASQPAVIFSDALNATNVTNANQVLTFGDNVALTALGGLALFNQLGGIIQSLMVFKDTSNIYQITGDPTTSNLSVNSLNITTGTLAPNTVVPTPQGLAFVAPDGVRLIDFNAKIEDPIGFDGMGITVPFISTVTPSRMCAACTGNILRISVQNGAAPGSPQQEWWYDFSRGIWSGPHTFPATVISPWRGTFITAPIGVTGKLFQSDVVQGSTSTYVENGNQLTYTYTTSMLPDTDKMTENSLTESIIDMAQASGVPSIGVSALDQNGTILGTVGLAAPAGGTVWGAFQWGAAPWGGSSNALAPRQLQWTAGIVFTRMQMQFTGQSAGSAKIGTLHLRYQILRYLSNLQAVA